MCVCPIFRVKTLVHGRAHGQLIDKANVDAREWKPFPPFGNTRSLPQDVRAIGGEHHGRLRFVHDGVETATAMRLAPTASIQRSGPRPFVISWRRS